MRIWRTDNRKTDIFYGWRVVARGDPTLQVVAEDDAGVIVSGMKMLATGAIFGDEVYIGNLTAIDDKRQSESITAAIPNNAPGVSFWAREPYERHAREEADYPLSYRFDENDAVLVCDRVKIPWERGTSVTRLPQFSCGKRAREDEIDWLRAFVSVAGTRSFTASGAALAAAQSTISVRVASRSLQHSRYCLACAFHQGHRLA